MFSIPVMRSISTYNIANAALPSTSAHMYFTPAADTAKQKQWTVHIPVGLIKGGDEVLFSAGDGASTNFVKVQTTATDQLDFTLMAGGAYVGRLTTTRLLRDHGAFTMITCVMDTPNATASDRMRVYIDLDRVTDFATATYPAQNQATSTFATYTHYFLKMDYTAYYGDVYLGGNTCLIGQALEPTNFLDLDLVTGNVKAKDLTPLSPEYLFMFENAANMGETRGVFSANLRTVGTSFGNMTSYGGPDAGFDGVTSQGNTSCAAAVLADTYIGRSWGSNKTITRFRVYSPNNEGFNASGADVEFRFYGSNTPPANAADGTLLLTSGAQTYSVPTSVYDSDMDGTLITTTGYAYHWVTMHTLGAVSTQYIAELEMFEAGTFGVNTVSVSGTLHQVTSTPTNRVAALSPLDTVWGSGRDGSGTLSSGNRRSDYPGAVNYGAHITDLAFTENGKIYGEALIHGVGSAIAIGLVSEEGKGSFNGATSGFGACPEGWARTSTGNQANNGTSFLAGPTLATNDRFIFAFDMVNAKGWFGKNGTWDSGDPALGTSPSFTFSSTSKLWHIFMQGYNGGAATLYTSQADWAYTAPVGFTANTTDNLPKQSGSIDNHFKAVPYTGTGSIKTVATDIDTNFAWIKSRNNTASHMLYDANRGAGYRLNTNATAAETLHVDTLTAFTSGGFTLGADTTTYSVNISGDSYVAWCASLPNTKTSGWAGSPAITPIKEIYNATLGMSIITFVGLGGVKTIPHSLGKKPGVMIFKNLTNSLGGTDWDMYHEGLGATKYLSLNTLSGATVSSTRFNDTEPTDSLITVGDSYHTNYLGDTFVAYLFAETDFLKVFSCAAADGLINLGGKAKFVYAKRDATNMNHNVWDATRDPGNPAVRALQFNAANAENVAGAWEIDIDANGIKLLGTNTDLDPPLYGFAIIQPNGPTENTAR